MLAILCNTRHQSLEITDVSYISPYLGETVVKFNHIRGDRQWSYRSLTTYHGSEDYLSVKYQMLKIVSPSIIQQLTRNNNPNPKTSTST